MSLFKTSHPKSQLTALVISWIQQGDYFVGTDVQENLFVISESRETSTMSVRWTLCSRGTGRTSYHSSIEAAKEAAEKKVASQKRKS